MIRISFNGCDRHGNRLFQLFTSVILSEMTNQNVENPFPTKIIQFNNKPHINHDETIMITDENLLLKFSENLVNKNIILAGYFQNEFIIEKFDEYYHLLNSPIEHTDGVFVHVRLGDLLGLTAEKPWFPSQKYYEEALNSISFSHGYISSDSMNHEIVRNIQEKYNLKSINMHEEDIILFGSSFKNKILSLGTFSWWMGYLGSQDNVFFPNPKNYHKWHGNIIIKDNWNKL